MCSAHMGGALPPPSAGRWVKVDQLAMAMFHRDFPVGVFVGQGDYLRLAAIQLGLVGRELAERHGWEEGARRQEPSA